MKFLCCEMSWGKPTSIGSSERNFKKTAYFLGWYWNMNHKLWKSLGLQSFRNETMPDSRRYEQVFFVRSRSGPTRILSGAGSDKN